MENLLTLLLGQNAFGGPGGPGGLGDAPAAGEGEGLFGSLGKMGKTFQALNPPQAQKPVFSGGVSGAGLPFLQKVEDMINPALNAQAQRRASVPQLPTMAQSLMGR
jgi:hypothetical protein